ncbi:ABC transporter ATP-binding protein [Phyllobacterium sp. 22229]|uniref:ABC transporter ATP-binding protein n=1 Tax=Agrobacterium radiobacter TaxID=362 RepID=A0ABD5LKQ7_AGRRD
MNSQLLEVKECNAHYGESHILHAISMDIEEGSGVALLGRNGAGKSTLFKSILGAGPTVTGDIRLRGRSIMHAAVHERALSGLSLVPEDRRIFPHISVEENLRFAERATRKGETALGIAEVVERFPMLGGLLDRRGYQLSGGQQQMLAVARGLVPRPLLLLLDEPAEGLAPLVVQELSEQIVRIRQREHVGLLLAEQNVGFARQCTEFVYILDSGRIVFRGDWSSFDADAELVNRYLAV